MSYVSDLNGSLKSLNDLYARLQDRARSSSGNNRTFNPHLVHGLYLHSNLLRTIEADVLGLFTSLTSLDLSSNLIECMKGLEATPGLVELNLSNNKIRRVEGLKSLYALRSLNLSFNQIKNLDGFQVIRGNRYSLEILDVKGNRIDDINTLDDLRGCTSLRHLVLHSESVISRVNPICASARYSPRMVFDVFPLLESVDGYSPSGLPVTVEPLLDGTSEYQEHASAATPEGFASGNIWDAPRGFPAEDDRTQYRDKQVLHLQNQVEALMASLDRRPTHLETKLSSDIAHLRSAYEEMRAFLRRDDPPKKGAQLREHNGAKPVSNANVDALARMEKQLAALSQIVAEKKSRTNGDEERRSGRQSPVGGGKARSGPKVTRTREKSPPVAVQSRKNATMATHRNANVENEDPDEQSSDGSDCTTSTKGRGVWPSARTEKSDSLIPKSRVSHGQKASTVSDATTKKKAAITLPANTKLISALEEEEKRLRANEVKYAEQIKALMEEVKTERELRSKAEAECGELKKELEPKKDAQNQMGILQEENAKLKAKAKESDQKMESLENVVKSQKVQIATMTNDVKILKADKTSLESQLASHKKKLDLAKDVVNDDKSALLNLEHQLQAAEESKSRLSMRLIKEREESKIRVAESNAELDVYKSTVKQLQKHLQSVQQQLANKESESGQRIRELSSTLNNELKTAISDTTKSLITKHRDEFDAVSKQLASTKHAYGVLEEEYRKRMREEQSRQSRLQAAYNEASERLAKTEKALDLATDKEKEMSCIIQELTLVVKEQKAKLAELEKQETLSFDVFEVRSLGGGIRRSA
ncbi:uncharacterized protein EV422DRAFT_234684 [Fimicolochytrium jonesii]|uniref:uncharacterized protein n=1 Tax=Fimicolochytrium jonesii TaxID=1396493 RepID=UPI0022FEF3EA|nr:uncharacterized protein EV422DRAFT_234684 [Fimicolochytrium jonesii]KAI8824824.1 hypothetical protein EV422DRAFT_234684 [Fimicolochytrium jonesii]